MIYSPELRSKPQYTQSAVWSRHWETPTTRRHPSLGGTHYKLWQKSQVYHTMIAQFPKDVCVSMYDIMVDLGSDLRNTALISNLIITSSIKE